MLCRLAEGSLLIRSVDGTRSCSVDTSPFAQINEVCLDRSATTLLVNAAPAGTPIKNPADALRHACLFAVDLPSGRLSRLHQGWTAGAAWLGDASIAFANEGPGVSTLGRDGTGLARRLRNPKLDSWFSQIRVSPGGGRFSCKQGNGRTSRLVVFDVAGGEPRTLGGGDRRDHCWLGEDRIVFETSGALYTHGVSDETKRLLQKDAAFPRSHAGRVYFLRPSTRALVSVDADGKGPIEHARVEGALLAGYSLLDSGRTFALTVERRGPPDTGPVVERRFRFEGEAAASVPEGWQPLSTLGHQPIHWQSPFPLPWKIPWNAAQP